MKNRILSLLLALVMVSSIFSATANAAALDNGLQYIAYADHVEIIDYNGTATELVIPAVIDGLPVTCIRDNTFNLCHSLTSIYIPASVTSVSAEAFPHCMGLEGIYVDESNPNYSSDDRGVLFDKTKTTLIRAPQAMTEPYVIPESVTSIGDSAFERCTDLAGIDLPDGVTSIGTAAFYGCYILPSVNIPDSVTFIGDWAFEYCRKLSSIVLPEGITSIGYAAFEGCTALTSVALPYSLTSISDWAFSDCTSLPNIYIPDSVASIGVHAFDGCSSLTSVYIPDSVTSIGEGAFHRCGKLTSINIPDSITAIASSTFTCCTSLTNITIPNSVTTIGDGAFQLCSNLTNIIIPNSVTTIGDGAFQDCSRLAYIAIPESVTSVGDYAFCYCSRLSHIDFLGSAPRFGEDVFYDVTATVIYYTSCVTWPEEVKRDYGGNITWVSMAESHEYNYTAVVTAPTCTEEGFTTFLCECGNSYVADYVDALDHDYQGNVCTRCGFDLRLQYRVYEDHVEIYRYNQNGTELIIPAMIEGKPVTHIADEAFSDCSKLTSVSIPDTVTSIGNEAFYFCHKLASITIPDSVTSIGDSAFWGCSSLTTIDVPASVTSIGSSAFGYCSKLTGIHVSDQNPNYCSDNRGVFFDKEKTQLLQAPCAIAGFYAIPAGVTSIVDAAFFQCVNLTSITIPESVRSIGTSAFYNCTKLADISLSEGLTSIGINAFGYCNRLKNITLPDSLTSIGSSAFNCCTTMTSINIPDGITSIDDNTFMGCFDLTSITIPESVSSIGRCAFHSCYHLTSVTIPEHVTYVGEAAFRECNNLSTIFFRGDAPDFEQNAFYNVTATAYYPISNATWTEDVMQNYAGTITWTPYDPFHTHEYTAAVTAPTCTEPGFTTYTCNCGDSYTAEHVDALGHVYADGSCTICGEAAPNPFSDVPADSFYAAPVLWALENGITTGTSDSTFSPNDQCLRSHVVTFLWRAEKSPEPSSTDNSFTDVKTGDFFYKPVLWAVENGITTGISSTEFGSYGTCNRAQVVTFLWRAAGKPEPVSTDNPFTDVKTTDFYYKPVLWALENGITTGLSPNEFGAAAPCNRAQVVTFLYRAYN